MLMSAHRVPRYTAKSISRSTPHSSHLPGSRPSPLHFDLTSLSYSILAAFIPFIVRVLTIGLKWLHLRHFRLRFGRQPPNASAGASTRHRLHMRAYSMP